MNLKIKKLINIHIKILPFGNEFLSHFINNIKFKKI